MENKKSRLWAVVTGGTLAFIFLTLFNGACVSGRVLFGHDFINIYLPFKLFAKQMFELHHDLPFWLPNIFFGIPLLASSSLLYFYPTDLLFMFLPFAQQYTYTADLLIHLLLAFFGTFLFLRRSGIRREAAFLPATVFMLSGFMISYIYPGHWNNIKAGALIPFIFYFIARGLDGKKLLHFLTAAIFMAMQILATGMQVMAYTYIGVFLYVIYRVFAEGGEKGGWKKPAVFFAIATAAAGVFSSLQLIPSVPFTNYSWRGNFTYDSFISWSFHPGEFITFLLPQFFGLFANDYYGWMPFCLTTYYFGIIPFLLVPFAFMEKKPLKFAIFLSIASFIFLILSFGGYTPVYGLFYYIPVLRQFRNPSRFLYLFTFFITVLSAVGLNNIMNAADKGKKDPGAFKAWKYTAIGASVLCLIFLFILPEGTMSQMIASIYRETKKTEVPPNFLYHAGAAIRQDIMYFMMVSAGFLFLVFLYLKRYLKPAFALAFLLVMANFMDMHRIDSKFISYEDYSKYISASDAIASVLKVDKDIYRTADFGFAWGPNRGIYYGAEEVKGVHGLVPKIYMDLETAQVFNIIAADRYFNIKYYISKTELAIQGFEKIFEGQTFLYRDPGFLPRFDFTDTIVKFPDHTDILSFMKNGKFDFKKALVTEDIPLAVSTEPLSYKLGLAEYSPNRIRLELETSKDGLLVIKDLYYPEWKVKVDNKPEKIYNVNYAFMGVPVKKGAHEVDFYYSRAGFYAGLLLTLLGTIAYCIVFFIERKRA